MTNFDGKEMQEEFNKAFGDFYKAGVGSLVIGNLTPAQLWWLIKFAKHVRGRCRNNSAFNNYMNRNFAPAIFKEIPKEYNDRHYMGLQIEVAGEISVGENGE